MGLLKLTRHRLRILVAQQVQVSPLVEVLQVKKAIPPRKKTPTNMGVALLKRCLPPLMKPNQICASSFLFLCCSKLLNSLIINSHHMIYSFQAQIFIPMSNGWFPLRGRHSPDSVIGSYFRFKLFFGSVSSFEREMHNCLFVQAQLTCPGLNTPLDSL